MGLVKNWLYTHRLMLSI